MPGSLYDWFCFGIHKNIVESILRTLKHHRCPLGVIVTNTDIKCTHSHLSKHCLLFGSIHVVSILFERVAELEIENSCFYHR